MVSRREVLFAGASCAFAATIFPTWSAYAQDEEWSCATGDPDITSEELGAITEFGSDDFEGDISQFISQLQTDGKITEYGTAHVASVWRRSDGSAPNSGKIVLGVAFLDGDQSAHDAVKLHASKWLSGALGQRMAFDWGVPQPRCHISITFNTNRNSSRIGRQSQDVARTQASMHLGQIHERTITHEFGHALGLRHEHSSPNAPIQWNEPQVIADMAQQGWTEQMVRSNIFARFSQEYACVGDPNFNGRSVMLYPIKASWTLNGFSSGQNNKIDARDEKCLVALYGA